jgi:hypothetical protein
LAWSRCKNISIWAGALSDAIRMQVIPAQRVPEETFVCNEAIIEQR